MPMNRRRRRAIEILTRVSPWLPFAFILGLARLDGPYYRAKMNRTNTTTVMEDPSLFGLILSTHRDRSIGSDAPSFFQYEALIAAIAIWFFRTTIIHTKNEPAPLRAFFAILLAVLAYMKKSYELIVAVELFSYLIPYLLFRQGTHKSQQSAATRLLRTAASALLSLFLSHVIVTGKLLVLMSLITPRFVVNAFNKLFPVEELKAAYRIIEAFSDPDVLRKQMSHLFFVTFHIQAGMGFLGINFLRKEQERRNQLLRMDMYGNDAPDAVASPENGSVSVQDDKKTAVLTERSAKFKKLAVPYILYAALPYMFKIIVFGNINKFAFACLQHDIHRSVRLNELFDHDSHLTALSNESPISPECKHKCLVCAVLSSLLFATAYSPLHIFS
jgi:hypothetical protein